MRLTKRQLRKAIRRVLIESMGDEQACIDECLMAIPPMMKQMCGMGMAHMVTNDIYHLCVPICQRHGCDPDSVSQQVEAILCGGMSESRRRGRVLREYVEDIRSMVKQGMSKQQIFRKVKKMEKEAGNPRPDYQDIYDTIDDVEMGRR